MIDKKTMHQNNFNILRFMAAIMVMAGHMSYIDGSGNLPVFWGQGVQTLGVKIFFLVGGYLISKSWLSDSNILRYSIKRIMRIFPALFLYVLFAALIAGPLFTNIPLQEYFSNNQFIRYFQNIIMFPVYSLPGVFTENPYSNVVNGSLWTLPVEVMMYILVPVILFLVGAKKKDNMSKNCLLGITVCVFQVLHLNSFPEWRKVIYGTDLAQAFSLIPYYFIGILYTYPEIQKKLNLEVAVVFLIVYTCISTNLSVAINELVTYFVFPYFIFSFALSEKPYFGGVFHKNEISYGIYLYGFLAQQGVVYFCLKNGIYMNSLGYLICSLLITCIFAMISDRMIEKPASRLCKKILVKL